MYCKCNKLLKLETILLQVVSMLTKERVQQFDVT